MVTLDTSLLLGGLIAEATVLGLLLRRHIYKQLPLFSAYLAWSLFNDLGVQFLLRRFSGAAMRIYLVSAIIDAVFVFCVLSEISMSVLKPVQASLPRWTLFVVAGLIAFVCAAVWPFAKPSDFHQGPTFQLVIAHAVDNCFGAGALFPRTRSAQPTAFARLERSRTPDRNRIRNIFTCQPSALRCCPAAYRAGFTQVPPSG